MKRKNRSGGRSEREGVMPSDWRMGKILRWKRLMGLNRGWNRGWSWTERVVIGGGHQQRGFRIGGGPQQRVVRREQRKKDRGGEMVSFKRNE